MASYTFKNMTSITLFRLKVEEVLNVTRGISSEQKLEALKYWKQISKEIEACLWGKYQQLTADKSFQTEEYQSPNICSKCKASVPKSRGCRTRQPKTSIDQQNTSNATKIQDGILSQVTGNNDGIGSIHDKKKIVQISQIADVIHGVQVEDDDDNDNHSLIDHTDDVYSPDQYSEKKKSAVNTLIRRSEATPGDSQLAVSESVQIKPGAVGINQIHSFESDHSYRSPAGKQSSPAKSKSDVENPSSIECSPLFANPNIIDLGVFDTQDVLHLQIEKDDGTVQTVQVEKKTLDNLTASAEIEVVDVQVKTDGKRDGRKAGGGKKLHLIQEQLDKVDKENEVVKLESEEVIRHKSENKAIPRKRHIKRDKRKKKERKKVVEGPFICSDCGFELSSDFALQVHRRKHSGAKPYGCGLCGRGFSTKANMLRHERSHDKTRDKLHACDMCDKRFVDVKSLRVHQRNHTGEKPFKCKYCDKAFTQSGILITHMMIHTGEKKHLCDFCGKSFRQKTQLKVHQKRHNNVLDFKCDRCEYRTVTKGEMERHMNFHLKRRPYLCKECPKTFTRLQYLKDHMNVHRGRTPYKCDLCEAAFPDKSSLRGHKLKQHIQEETQYHIITPTQHEALTRVEPVNDSFGTEYHLECDNFTENSLTNELQVVINETATEQELAQLQTIIVSAAAAEVENHVNMATQTINTGQDGFEQALEVMECGEENEVYQISLDNGVVVDFSAINLLANTTTRQFQVQ